MKLRSLVMKLLVFGLSLFMTLQPSEIHICILHLSLCNLALHVIARGQAYFFIARMAFIAAMAFMAFFFFITRMAFFAGAAAAAFIARMAFFFFMTRMAFFAGAAFMAFAMIREEVERCSVLLE